MMSFKRFLWLSVFVTLVFSMGLGWTNAQAGNAPVKAEAKADWKFHHIVSVEFVQQYVKIPTPENVTIIDSRPYKPKYVQGHIPTAISIPDSQFDKEKDKLPQDKNALLIFYCGGLK